LDPSGWIFSVPGFIIRKKQITKASRFALMGILGFSQLFSWKMGPSNSSFLSFRVAFHFHDFGRKSSLKNNTQKDWKKNWMMTEMSRDLFVASEGFLNTDKHRQTAQKKGKPAGRGHP